MVRKDRERKRRKATVTRYYVEQKTENAICSRSMSLVFVFDNLAEHASDARILIEGPAAVKHELNAKQKGRTERCERK